MAAQSRYQDNTSSDESFDWSSDSAPKTKRKSTRKTKSSDAKGKITIAEGPIKKAKKPGRKPLAKVTVLPSDPKLKRKAQNRAAQRAFRERKEQFVNELQEQMRELQALKEKREKELTRENARLKKENERLKEENYVLKDAKFTFEFPHKRRASDKSQPARLVSPPITDNQHNDDVLSITSPLSNEEECGELSDYNGGKTSTASDSTSSVPACTFDATNSTSNGSNFAPDFSFTPTQETSDLFSGKDNLFLKDYRVPANEADFLIQNEPLPQLFGDEVDLFSIENPAPFSTSELDPLFSEEMQNLVEKDSLLNCAPENEKPCKSKLLAVLGKAKGANRRMYQIHNDVKSYCPDLNLDQLCEDLKRKITFDSNHILTDEDVDLYIECIQRNKS